MRQFISLFHVFLFIYLSIFREKERARVQTWEGAEGDSRASSVCIYYNILSHCLIIISILVWLAIHFLMTVNLFYFVSLLYMLEYLLAAKERNPTQTTLSIKGNLLAQILKRSRFQSGLSSGSQFFL